MDSPVTDPSGIKSCCARLYESDFVRLLLGESFHPGGVRLTTRLGELLELHPATRVLDVASGRGASALHLATEFGCEVIGIDYSSENVRQATQSAKERNLSDRVRFFQGDSESLQFEDASFDAIICECAFCTFPNKPAAAREFARVLRPGGRFGMSDMTRSAPLGKELTDLMAWIACIADARPVEDYRSQLSAAGFVVEDIELHNEALVEMLQDIRAKLFGLEIAVGLNKLDLPGVDFTTAKTMASAAASAIEQGDLGYAIVCATRRS